MKLHLLFALAIAAGCEAAPALESQPMPGLALETSAADAEGVTTVRLRLAFAAPRPGVAILLVDGRELARLAIAAGTVEATTEIAVEGAFVAVPAWSDEPEPPPAPPQPTPPAPSLPLPPAPKPAPPPPPILDSIAAVRGY